MNAYSEFIDPSRVSNCVGCNFISPTSKSLIVAKSNVLQIFEVVNTSSNTKVRASNSSKSFKLKLVEQFKLHGLITDLKPIRTLENPDLDYLLVSTKFAKFSLIKWNHHQNSIQTISLHYYEQALQNLTYEEVKSSQLLVEPNNYSCSCLRFQNLLTFLPFEGLDNEDEDDEEDEEDDSTKKEKEKENGKPTDVEANGSAQPFPTVDNYEIFDSSFIINASSLDSSIKTIIDMKFLHNYKEPTLAILSLRNDTWAGKLTQVKDNVNFIVLSLDLNAKSSTTVLKIDNLPYDVDRLIALPLPLNGSLLLGCNEIIHIDNGGITRRIAVNEFTSLITASTKNYLDQSSLNLKLEYSSVYPIPNDNRVLLVLQSGELFYINFQIDGKSIKKMVLEEIETSHYEELVGKFNLPGDIAHLDNNLMFVSNKNSDSHLVQLHYADSVAPAANNGSKEKTEAKKKKLDSDSDMNDDDEDDLYGDDEVNEENVEMKGTIVFRLQDELVNCGPTSTFTLGHYSTEKFIANLANPNFKEICIISNGGSNHTGHLNVIAPSIQASIRSSLSFSQINRMWNINNKFLITSDDTQNKSEIFQINKSYARLNAKHFINSELTIAMHELNSGKFILQITPKHVILFNTVFKKLVTLDEELSKDFQNDDIINSYLNDEYLMLFFASGEVLIYIVNTYNESFSKINIPKILADTIITSGYITNSHLLNAVLKDVNLLISRGVKRKRNLSLTSSTVASNDATTLGPKLKTFVLVTGDNRIVTFNRFHNERCYQLNDTSKFTDELTLGFFEPRDTYPDPLIKQVIFNELGDQHTREEYLTILTIGGEIIMYKLFFDGENYLLKRVKDLLLTGAPHNAYPQGTSIERRLVYLPNFNGFTTIVVPGVTPYIIMKTSHSIPRIFKFGKIPIVSFASFSDSKVKNGIIYLDTKKNARIVELPLDFNYENTLPVKRILIKETIRSITYHETSNSYVLSTFKESKYDCLDEENNPIVGIDPSKPGPHSYQGLIKLLSTLTWTVIDSVEFDNNEIGMSIKSMVLDVGISQKKFKNKKEYIVVGTGKYRIEDLGANGSFKVFEIIDIIPEPGKPETNHKFKEFYKEDTKGAATSVCELSGRFLVAQGQKIIVRDIQDNGVTPVAFLDTSVYVSEAKSFGNMLILGDSLKSLWLVGFDAEPFRMIMLGKDLQSLDVNCADFLVKDEEIYLIIADNSNVVHIVQYNPEDPSSSNGQRLIHKSAFNLTSTSTCLRLLPKHEEIYGNPEGFNDYVFQAIGSNIDGSFYVVFPTNESTYRRMYILQQQLIDKEFHYCGLNPRLNRFGGIPLTYSDTNTKPLLDYLVIKSFAYLNEDRKRNLALKVGNKTNIEQDIWKDFVEIENVLKHM